MGSIKMTAGKIGGGKSAGKSPVRSVPKGVTKQAKPMQRTVAPAKGYGQTATGRNATAERRAVSNSVRNAANKAAITSKIANSMTQGTTGRTVQMNKSWKTASLPASTFSAEANSATQSMANKKKRSY